MNIQQAENEFYELFPKTQNQMIKTALCFQAVDSLGFTVPLEAYKVVKTYDSAMNLITRYVDPNTNDVYYDAYPGELISVVADSSSFLNGVYMVTGTQNPDAQGLSLQRLAFADE